MNEKIYEKLNELAEKSGCSEIMSGYSDVRTGMKQRKIKQYALLGDVNSGKSTVINILAGEKKIPASMRTNEHGKVVYAESEKDNCRWVELNSYTYGGDGQADIDSLLWHMDAAVYLICATAPFSKQDVSAIKACIAHGVPCSLALNKLDLIDEAERDEVIAYVRDQAKRHFGSDSLIVISGKDAEVTKKAIINAFSSVEDYSDVKDYMLAVNYAKELKKQIEEKFESAKEKMQAASEREKQMKQKLLDEKIAWDKIIVKSEEAEYRLIEAMTEKMKELYAECVENLADKAINAKSPKDWWEQSLEKEFRVESDRISGKIEKMIRTQVSHDRDWLVQSVEKSFGSRLSVGSDGVETQLEDIMFGIAPERLESSSKTKPLAIAGLVVSSAVLVGTLCFPLTTLQTIAGMAVAGTGFWTYFETKKNKTEKQQYLKEELSGYIYKCRDDNINALKRNIKYVYENIRISVEDLKLAVAKPSQNKDDEKIYAEFEAISAIKTECDEIIKGLTD